MLDPRPTVYVAESANGLLAAERDCRGAWVIRVPAPDLFEAIRLLGAPSLAWRVSEAHWEGKNAWVNLRCLEVPAGKCWEWKLGVLLPNMRVGGELLSGGIHTYNGLAATQDDALRTAREVLDTVRRAWREEETGEEALKGTGGC